MNKTFSKIIKNSFFSSISISTAVLTFVPESSWTCVKLVNSSFNSINIISNRLLFLALIFVVALAIQLIYVRVRKKVSIKGHNYSLQVEYGNLFDIKDGKVVISFDECFTTTTGEKPAEIKPTSICGQYLAKFPIDNMAKLIENAKLKPAKYKSDFEKKECYESGRVIPRDNFLLLAFAKLNSQGLGVLTKKEYLDSLSVLWDELDKYYCQHDVYIPILGSGITRIDSNSINQQEALDLIIESYKLSTRKLQKPCILHIVCRKQDGFSINKIGETI